MKKTEQRQKASPIVFTTKISQGNLGTLEEIRKKKCELQIKSRNLLAVH